MRSWLPGLLVLALLLAACGDNGDGAETRRPGAAGAPDSGPATQVAASADAPADEDADDLELVSDGERRGTVPFSDLRTGDCFWLAFNAQGETDLSQLPEVVDCGELHNAEVVRAARVRSEANDPWPGGRALNDTAARACDAASHQYLGTTPPSFPLPLIRRWLVPGEQSWNAGTRIIICYVVLRDDGFELQGSVRGVGRGVTPAGFPAGAPLAEGFELNELGQGPGYSGSRFSEATLVGWDVPHETVVYVRYWIRGFDQLADAVPPFEAELARSDWRLVERNETGEAERFDLQIAYRLERDGTEILVIARGRMFEYLYPAP